MVKTVYSNSSEVLHIWAQQPDHDVKCGNVFTRGAVVYSYGYHYPLGIIATNKKGKKAVIINTAGYSVTTSKYISQARYATNHYETRLDIPSTQAMRALEYQRPSEILTGMSEAISLTVARYDCQLRNDTKKRKAATLERFKSEAVNECASYIAVLDFYNLKMTPAARAAFKRLSGTSVENAKAMAIKAKAKEDKAREKAQREKDARDKVMIEEVVRAFIAGEKTGYYESEYLFRAPVHMRVNGEEIETSRGASFPLAHGLKALPIIRAIVASGETWQRNGKTIHLGHYQIDRIEGGNIIAGCHTLPVAEVERLAASLGV